MYPDPLPLRLFPLASSGCSPRSERNKPSAKAHSFVISCNEANRFSAVRQLLDKIMFCFLGSRDYSSVIFCAIRILEFLQKG